MEGDEAAEDQARQQKGVPGQTPGTRLHTAETRTVGRILSITLIPHEVGSVNCIDDIAGDHADGEPDGEDRQAGQRRLRQQQKGRIAHGGGQHGHHGPEGDTAPNILGDHHDRAATAGQGAKGSRDRDLPDAIARQQRGGVDFEPGLQRIEYRQRRGDKDGHLQKRVGKAFGDDAGRVRR